jgi:hypothetical protein
MQQSTRKLLSGAFSPEQLEKTTHRAFGACFDLSAPGHRQNSKQPSHLLEFRCLRSPPRRALLLRPKVTDRATPSRQDRPYIVYALKERVRSSRWPARLPPPRPSSRGTRRSSVLPFAVVLLHSAVPLPAWHTAKLSGHPGVDIQLHQRDEHQMHTAMANARTAVMRKSLASTITRKDSKRTPARLNTAFLPGGPDKVAAAHLPSGCFAALRTALQQLSPDARQLLQLGP